MAGDITWPLWGACEARLLVPRSYGLRRNGTRLQDFWIFFLFRVLDGLIKTRHILKCTI